MPFNSKFALHRTITVEKDTRGSAFGNFPGVLSRLAAKFSFHYYYQTKYYITFASSEQKLFQAIAFRNMKSTRIFFALLHRNQHSTFVSSQKVLYLFHSYTSSQSSWQASALESPNNG